MVLKEMVAENDWQEVRPSPGSRVQTLQHTLKGGQAEKGPARKGIGSARVPGWTVNRSSVKRFDSLTQHSGERKGVLMSTTISRAPRQAKCGICGKLARPGSAIVQHDGAGGRAHLKCKKTAGVNETAVYVTVIHPQLNEAKRSKSERCHNVAR